MLTDDNLTKHRKHAKNCVLSISVNQLGWGERGVVQTLPLESDGQDLQQEIIEIQQLLSDEGEDLARSSKMSNGCY